MGRYIAFLPLAIVAAACTPVPPDAPGMVTAFNGSSVEVRGGFPWDGNFASTPGLDATARAQCPNARWVGYRDDGQTYYITHIYRC